VRKFRQPIAPAKKVSVDGITFDSQSEAARYGTLKLMQSAKLIRNLQVHPKFDLIIYGKNGPEKLGSGKITLDFRYEEWRDAEWRDTIEDCKGFDTRESALRRRICEILHGFKIKIVHT
jgi:hypothetical protein